MEKKDSDSINPMAGAFEKLKRMVMDPKVYALVVKTNRMAILHVGVHYSLDEAFAAVKQRALNESKTKDLAKLDIDMWMWEVMPAPAILARFFGKEIMPQAFLTQDLSTGAPVQPEVSTAEYAKKVYAMKNELMKRIIDTKDLTALAEAETFLTETELKLIREKIAQPKGK